MVATVLDPVYHQNVVGLRAAAVEGTAEMLGNPFSRSWGRKVALTFMMADRFHDQGFRAVERMRVENSVARESGARELSARGTGRRKTQTQPDRYRAILQPPGPTAAEPRAAHQDFRRSRVRGGSPVQQACQSKQDRQRQSCESLELLSPTSRRSRVRPARWLDAAMILGEMVRKPKDHLDAGQVDSQIAPKAPQSPRACGFPRDHSLRSSPHGWPGRSPKVS